MIAAMNVRTGLLFCVTVAWTVSSTVKTANGQNCGGHQQSRHGDTADNLGGSGAGGNRNGVLELRAEYGASAAPEWADEAWLQQWGHCAPGDFDTSAYYKDEIALVEAIRDAGKIANQTGKPIQLEPGEYWLSHEVEIKHDGLTLRGSRSMDGGWQVAFRSSTAAPPIKIDFRPGNVPHHHVTLQDIDLGWSYIDTSLTQNLRLIGLRVGLPGGPRLFDATTGTWRSGIVLRGCADVVVEDCHVVNVGKDCVAIQDSVGGNGDRQPSRRIVVVDSTMTDCGVPDATRANMQGAGMAVRGTVDELTAIGCVARRCSYRGFLTDASSAGSIRNVQFVSCMANQISNSEASLQSGFHVEDSELVSIWGGEGADNEERCVTIGQNTRQITVTDFSCNASPPPRDAGITVGGSAGSTAVVVSDCTINGDPAATGRYQNVGLRFSNAFACVGRANTVQNCAAAGIQSIIGSCPPIPRGTLIVGNTVSHSGPDTGAEFPDMPVNCVPPSQQNGCGIALRGATTAVAVTGNTLTDNRRHLCRVNQAEWLIIDDNVFSSPTNGCAEIPACPP